MATIVLLATMQSAAVCIAGIVAWVSSQARCRGASTLTQVIQLLLHPLEQRQAQLQLLQLLGLLCAQLAVPALKGCHSCSSCRYRCVLVLVPVLPALSPDAFLEPTREQLE